MVHRNIKPLKYSAACIIAGLLVSTLGMPQNAWARDTEGLQQCLDVFKWYIDENATVRFRGYYRPSKELAWVKRNTCDMVIKRKIWGFPTPARSTPMFKQYFHVPLYKIDTARMERINYRNDVGPYEVGQANLAYYGFAVVLKTGFWDIKVLNRLGDEITREREIQIVFKTEKTAREFLDVAKDTIRECTVHSLGAGEDWNQFSFD